MRFYTSWKTDQVGIYENMTKYENLFTKMNHIIYYLKIYIYKKQIYLYQYLYVYFILLKHNIIHNNIIINIVLIGILLAVKNLQK